MTTKINNANSIQNKWTGLAPQIWHSTTDRISKAAEKSIHFCGEVFEAGKAAIQFATRPISHAIDGIINILKQSASTGSTQNISQAKENNRMKETSQALYERLTRYLNITPAAWASYASEIEELCTAVEKGSWNNKVFQQHDILPYVALGALHEQKISLEQFCSVMLFWTAHEDAVKLGTRVIVVPLFINGKINPTAEKTILGTLRMHSKNEAQFKEQYFKAMKNKPISEQYFFTMEDPEKIYCSQEEYLNRKDTMAERLENRNFNHFFRCYSIVECSQFKQVNPEVKRLRMVPSFTMMQTYLDVKFKDQAVEIRPVIGLATEGDIRENGLSNSREMSLPFPHIPFPKIADTVACPLLTDFIHHDFYHADRCSAILDKHRPAFIEIADLVHLAKQRSVEEETVLFESLEEGFIDMELPTYTIFPHLNKRLLFWVAIEKQIHDMTEYHYSCPPWVVPRVKDDLIRNTKKLLAETLVTAIHEDEKKWLESYEVSLQDLVEAMDLKEVRELHPVYGNEFLKACQQKMKELQVS